METIIVYVDDAEYALAQLEPMQSAANPVRWIVVACAPHMTRYVGKWLSYKARQGWRERWSEKVFSTLRPALDGYGNEVHTQLADRSLPLLTEALRRTYAAARVLDARRPKFGHELPAVTATQKPHDAGATWAVTGSTAAMGVFLVLAAE
jgi:hypothetical protein